MIRVLLLAWLPASAVAEERVVIEARRGRPPAAAVRRDGGAAAEPGGLPPLPGATRLARMDAGRFAAAWYRAPARPREFLRRAAARLAAAGWRVTGVLRGGFLAARPGRGEAAVYAEDDEDGGTLALVMAARPAR